MWLTDFRNRLEQEIHRLLWKQWTTLGVAGSTPPSDQAVIDPESLLLFTLEAARTDPRLFDEVLDWLLKNGRWVDVQRLRNVARANAELQTRVLDPVAALLAEQETSDKWKRLAATGEGPAVNPETLFIAEEVPPGTVRPLDPQFEKAGFERGPFRARGLSVDVPILAAPCLRFRLRALFGIGIRAEAVTLLLARGPAHANDIARQAGYSFPGTLQALKEMASSGSVHMRIKGREKHYWLDKDRWWTFLRLDGYRDAARSLARQKLMFLEGLEGPALQEKAEAAVQQLAPVVTWANWTAFYHGLAMILRCARRRDLRQATPYVQSSEMNQVFKKAGPHLSAAEAPFQPPPQAGRSPEAFAQDVVTAVQEAHSIA